MGLSGREAQPGVGGPPSSHRGAESSGWLTGTSGECSLNCQMITAKLVQLLGWGKGVPIRPNAHRGSHHGWPSWDRVCGRHSTGDCCFLPGQLS